MSINSATSSFATQMAYLSSFSEVHCGDEAAKSWPAMETYFLEPNGIAPDSFGKVPDETSHTVEVIRFRESVLERGKTILANDVDSLMNFTPDMDRPSLAKLGFENQANAILMAEQANMAGLLSARSEMDLIRYIIDEHGTLDTWERQRRHHSGLMADSPTITPGERRFLWWSVPLSMITGMLVYGMLHLVSC